MQSALISLLGFHLNIARTVLLTVVCMSNYSQQILLWLKEIQNHSKLLYLQVVYQFLLCINSGNPLRPVLPIGEMGFRYFANLKNLTKLKQTWLQQKGFFLAKYTLSVLFPHQKICCLKSDTILLQLF